MVSAKKIVTIVPLTGIILIWRRKNFSDYNSLGCVCYFPCFLFIFFILKFSFQYVAAYWDVEKGEIILCDAVDISIAVALRRYAA